MNSACDKRSVSRLRSRLGFALLMVLAVLTIVAVIGARLATTSLESSIEARLDVEALRDKWATESACRSLLPHAASVLVVQAPNSDEERDLVPIPMLELPLMLSGEPVTLRLFDESSKANVRRLMRRRPLQTGRKLLTKLTKEDPSLSGRVRSARWIAAELKRNEITGWPQLIELQRDPSNPGPRIGQNVTLWGDGRLNLQTTSKATVEAVCGVIVGDAKSKRAAAAIRNDSAEDLRGMALTRRQRSSLEQTFCWESSCYAIQVEKKSGRDTEIRTVELDGDPARRQTQ